MFRFLLFMAKRNGAIKQELDAKRVQERLGEI